MDGAAASGVGPQLRALLAVSVAMRRRRERRGARRRARCVAWSVGLLCGVLGCQPVLGSADAWAASRKVATVGPSAEARGFLPATGVSHAAGLGFPASRVVLNDRGQAAIISFTPNPTGRGPSLEQVTEVLPRQVLMPSVVPLAPGTLGASTFSAALSPTGRLVVGTATFDGSLLSDDPHSALCCSENALASWQLGQPPPVPQLLLGSGANGPAPDRQALAPPLLAIGSRSVTALWLQGSIEGFAPAHLQRAAGPLTGPFASGPVDGATIDGPLELAVDPRGGVVADYFRGANAIVTLVGRDGNHLHRTHSRSFVGLSRGDTSGLGLVTDAQANGLLAYRLTRSRLIVGAYRSTHGAFGRVRRLMRLDPGYSNLMLVGGGRRRALLAWSDRRGHLRVALGGFSSGFGPATDLGAASTTGVGSLNLDRRGRSLVIWERFSHVNRDGTYAYTIEASTAGPTGQFTAPQQVSPHGQDCLLTTNQTPVAYSPAGRALIAMTCDFTYNNPDGAFRVARYRP